MSLTELILISLGLSMDCFAVSLTLATCRKPLLKDILRMAFFFGAFQGLMPLIGWILGNSMQSLIEPVDHWIAFAILAFIGAKMVWQSFLIHEKKKITDIRKLSVLLTLSIATSIDALITGIGFGFIRVNVYEAVFIIAIITFTVSFIGARIGGRTSFIPARWAEFSGGIVLIGIGVKVVLDHLLLI